MFYPIDTWLDPWISIPALVIILSLIIAQTRRPVLHGVFSLMTLGAMICMLLMQGLRIQ